ncbi:5-methylthioadenosine/S-adenosylhomocysteine deaminase [Microbacterium halimionae]|uniref:5-methylthioadenosine/S-adenosylhomocysteine deaminase n=1 Tax=Microbacterium halimionae TaxID=1526413 RepID=A0A7W3JQG8_9MICO|nr:amidohydrolase [Microbacterium halimionae]MBA8817134.1 5-methylthioadenosine/S-adenosylhomocysteine deaminase [Microbacterium halimionae]NII94584.1 5-methylthioadenosine/S-adenosylhomocysteine deaminase [Microbacterium halimionae]
MTSQLLTADIVVTMNATRDVLVDAGIVIEGDTIIAVGAASDLALAYPDAARTHFADRVLMPGLVNSHHHSGMLRGTAEHLPVWEWLRLHIDPMHRVLKPEDAEAAAWLCYAEGLLSGTTTVVDMWRYMDGAARAASALGNRLVTVNYVGEHPDYNYFDTLDDNEKMLQEWTGAAGGRIMPWVGLEHPFYADAAGQRRAISLAKQYDTGLYTHCSESELDVELFDHRTGKRPMFALEDIGFFDVPRTMIAHAVWLDAPEIALMAERGVSVSHNPVSNMKLASGFAPVAELLAAGVAVGIGTDGEKENNNLDMFEEMKVASLMGKLRKMDAAAMDSWQVLEMATTGGARAIGEDGRLGSLEVGKQADIVAVRTDTPRMTPLLPEGPYANIHHNLVHAVRGDDVTHTIVAGRTVVADGELVTADMPELIARVRELVPGLFARRTAYLESAGELGGLMG